MGVAEETNREHAEDNMRGPEVPMTMTARAAHMTFWAVLSVKLACTWLREERNRRDIFLLHDHNDPGIGYGPGRGGCGRRREGIE